AAGGARPLAQQAGAGPRKQGAEPVLAGQITGLGKAVAARGHRVLQRQVRPRQTASSGAKSPSWAQIMAGPRSRSPPRARICWADAGARAGAEGTGQIGGGGGG